MNREGRSISKEKEGGLCFNGALCGAAESPDRPGREVRKRARESPQRRPHPNRPGLRPAFHSRCRRPALRGRSAWPNLEGRRPRRPGPGMETHGETGRAGARPSRMRDAGCRMRDAGCGMRDAECGMRDAGCGMRDAGCGMEVAGWRLRDGDPWHDRSWRAGLRTAWSRDRDPWRDRACGSPPLQDAGCRMRDAGWRPMARQDLEDRPP